MTTPPVLVPPPIPTTNPPPKSGDNQKMWASVVAFAISCGTILAGLVLVPDDRLAHAGSKVSNAIAFIVADPQGAAAGVLSLLGFIAAVIAGARALFHATPSTSRPTRTTSTSGFAHVHALGFVILSALFFLAGCSLLAGCGASALQSGAVAVTVALRAEEAVDDVYQADLARRQDECPPAISSGDTADVHNVCVEHERAATASITEALTALEIGIRAVGAGIAAATEIDAGQPIPAVVLEAIRQALALFDRVEVALREGRVDVPPEIGLVVAALSALVGPAS